MFHLVAFKESGQDFFFPLLYMYEMFISYTHVIGKMYLQFFLLYFDALEMSHSWHLGKRPGSEVA